MWSYTVERVQSVLLSWWYPAWLRVKTICCHIKLSRNADAFLVHSIPSLTIWSGDFIDFTFTAHILAYFKCWNLIFNWRCFNNLIRYIFLTWNICVDALRRNWRHMRFTFVFLDCNRIIFWHCSTLNQIFSHFLLSDWRNVQIHLKFRCFQQNLFLRIIAYTIALGF